MITIPQPNRLIRRGARKVETEEEREDGEGEGEGEEVEEDDSDESSEARAFERSNEMCRILEDGRFPMASVRASTRSVLPLMSGYHSTYCPSGWRETHRERSCDARLYSSANSYGGSQKSRTCECFDTWR